MTPTSADREQRLADLLTQLSERQQRGESVNLDDSARANPDIADELCQLWAAAQVASAFGRRSSAPRQAAATAQRDDRPPPALPRTFGDYQLLEELGRGGMGVVYRARQISLDRIVALKMLRDIDSNRPEEAERFRLEAETAARLNHPNIVPVYEVGAVGGQMYFTMQYVEGTTLARLVAEHPLAPIVAAQYVAIIARAVHAAHRQGILHRDLKPANVLLVRSDPLQRVENRPAEAGHYEPRVTDFGLAKRFEGKPGLTSPGSILGTPAYMPPEQASGSRGTLSPASDVYSLGAILYELLTGRPPFQAAMAVDTLLLVLDQEPVSPRRLNPQVDRGLELICLKCLQKQPDLRYASAAKLAEDLERFGRGERPAVWSGSFRDVVGSLFRETPNAPVLENWGVLWMWHSLKIFLLCVVTNWMYWAGVRDHLAYLALWSVGLIAWGSIFWALRRRGGPVLVVERQVAHVWAAGVMATIGIFIVEWLMAPAVGVLELSPMLAIVAGMVFVVKAGMLAGVFYLFALALFLTAIPMAIFPSVAPLLFGVVSAGCFFIPGLYYHRRLRARSE